MRSVNHPHPPLCRSTEHGYFRLEALVVILIVVTLVFGTKKLKNLGSDLGETIKGFRKAMNEDESKSSEQPLKSQQALPNLQHIHVQASKTEEL